MSAIALNNGNPPTLGLMYDGFMTTINERLKQELKESKEESVDTGVKICLAIQNTKNVDEQFLNLTLDKVGVDVKTHFDQIGKMIQELQEKNKLNELKEKAHKFIDSLTLANWQPKLMKTEFFKDFVLKFFGNFKYATTKNYETYFKIKEKVLKPIQANKECLEFQLDSNDLISNEVDKISINEASIVTSKSKDLLVIKDPIVNSASPSPIRKHSGSKYHFPIGILCIPYESSWFFSNIKTFEYQILLVSSIK